MIIFIHQAVLAWLPKTRLLWALNYNKVTRNFVFIEKISENFNLFLIIILAPASVNQYSESLKIV